MSEVRRAFPLQRAVPALRGRPYDLLVIGGGIYGAWTACDAAARGLSVALVEARDWAAGTSSASSKLIHGGLRYLENFEFGLVRESLHERRTLSRIAPHLVRPLRFAMPVSRGDRAGRLKLAAGLTLYDLLAGRDQPVARHGRLSRAAMRKRFPFMAAEALLGGFDYGDCQEDDARLTLEVVAAAQAQGADCANRVTAETLLEENGRIHGARLHDTETGDRFELRAQAVVVAAGPWSRALLGAAAPPMQLVKGVHLVMPAIPDCRHAFLLTAPQDGRVMFVIPWYGRTLVGTTEAEVADPQQLQVAAAERQYLLEAVVARLPGLGWRASDIIACYAGVRTLPVADTKSLSALSREFKLLNPKPDLWLPLGGKFTTSRNDAQGIVDRLVLALGRPVGDCGTAQRVLPGAPAAPFPSWLNEQRTTLQTRLADLATDQIDSLLYRYGRRAADLAALIESEPALARRIHPELPFIDAEIALARRDEMARDLDDVLRRRIPLDLLAAKGDWRSHLEKVFEQSTPA